MKNCLFLPALFCAESPKSLIRMSMVLFCSFTITSCETFDKDEPIPGYLKIDDFILSVDDPITQGSSSESITDAWVYIDESLIGAFELPAMVPILATGKRKLKIFPGIKKSGATLLRTEYPFYQPFINDSTYNLIPGETQSIVPVTKYWQDAYFAWIEDFEDPGITVDDLSGTASLTRTTDPLSVFEGNGSGKIILTETQNSYEGITSDGYVFPKGGNKIYLEMDYLNSINFTVILYGITASTPQENLVAVLYPTNKSGALQWNKIYLDLTDAVLQMPQAVQYKIKFLALLESGNSYGEIRIDNLKLLYQQ